MRRESAIKLMLARWLLSSLMGLTAGDWWQLLRENGLRVHPLYWPRAAAVTACSFVTSVIKRFDDRACRDRLSRVVLPSPLVIVGHWRGGTTYLHHLLALSPGALSPNLYEVLHPHSILAGEKAMAPLWRILLTRTRLIDPLPLSADDPQEEEFALALLSSCSPYLSYSFPGARERYDRFLTTEGFSDDEAVRWLRSLDGFLKRLALAKGTGRPILKSPASTGRLTLVLRGHPAAKFVHISRHPYEIFLSTRRMLEISIPLTKMQRRPFPLDETIISRYRTMYDAYFRQRAAVPRGQLCEVRYEDLQRSPAVVLHQISRDLGLPRSEDIARMLEDHVRRAGSYRPRDHAPLPRSLKERLRTEWGRCFEEWDYDGGG